MTITELRADPTYERHQPPSPPPASHAAWLKVAAEILATPVTDLEHLDRTERESRSISLTGLEYPDARDALAKLDGLPAPRARKSDS